MYELKKTGWILLLGLVAVFLQSSVFHAILPGGVPNISLAMTVCIGFLDPTAFGAVLAFFLGLEYDLSSASLLGPWAGSFVLVYGGLASLSQRLFVESKMAVAFVTFVAAVFADGVALLLRSPSNLLPSLGDIGALLVTEGIYTAIAAPLIYPLMRKVLAKKDARRGRSNLLMA